MKTRPILFSGSMVRALLDGRKTQTRRLIKPEKGWNVTEYGLDLTRDDAMRQGFAWFQANGSDMPGNYLRVCPYGKPGDLLWVRESFTEEACATAVCYKADFPIVWPADRTGGQGEIVQKAEDYKFRPSIHMPRRVSRITLEITSVRVERLNDISEADAVSEGVKQCPNMNGISGTTGYVWPDSSYDIAKLCHSQASTAFREGWAIINGEESWNSNPWVWVIEFKVHRCNVDALPKQREAA